MNTIYLQSGEYTLKYYLDKWAWATACEYVDEMCAIEDAWSKRISTCNYCSIVDDSVYYTTDPFLEQIHGVTEHMWICDNCHCDRLDEI